MTLRVTSNIFTIHRKIIKLEIRYRNYAVQWKVRSVVRIIGNEPKGKIFIKKQNKTTKIKQEFFPCTALNAYTEKYIW